MEPQNPEIFGLAIALANVLSSSREMGLIKVETFDYVTISLASSLTGLSVKAIERKVQDGKWIEGKEWVRAPDGHIMISREGVKLWVEKGLTLKPEK